MNIETIFRIAFWALLAGMFLMRAFFSVQVRRSGERLMPDRQAVRREGRGMFAGRVLLFFILLGWLVLYAVNPSWLVVLEVPLPAWLRWPGFALGVITLGLLAWTQAALGRHWSPQLQLREGHHLVTTGPYARIRHPLYASGIGWLVGVALLTANWIFIFTALLATVGLAARIPREEQMLLDQFGEEYRAYMQRTGRFFPK